VIVIARPCFESWLGFSDDEDDKSKNKKVKPKKETGKKVHFSSDVKDDDDDEDEEDGEEGNPLITDLDPRDRATKRIQKAQMWFEKVSSSSEAIALQLITNVT
jgi:hypothetical protein